MMKAIGLTLGGDADVLKSVEVAKPTPGPRDLIVKIKAVATNPVDFKVRKRTQQQEKPLVIGWDAAGVVESVGSEVQLYKVGDEVYFAGSIRRPGCNSEYCAVDERIVGKKPNKLSFEDAAAIPLTGLTAWEALVENMRIPIPSVISDNYNKTLLVTAGAGGVGSIAIQIAKKVLKLKVVATASRPESIEFCKKMGADYIIDHNKDFSEEFKRIGLDGADYILECSSFDKYFDQEAKILKPFGHICGIVEASNPVNITNVMGKRGTVSYELMFTRPITGVEMEKQKEILDALSKLIDEGIIEPRVTVRFDHMNKLVEAHKIQESGKTLGKIVITANF